MAIPKGWYIDAHNLWSKGRRLEAVQAAIAHINTFGIEKPISLVLQLAYYFYLLNDYRSAATVLEDQFSRHPRHLETVLNLAVCYSRLGYQVKAAARANDVLVLEPDNVLAYDILAKAQYSQGNLGDASIAGTRALELKDRSVAAADDQWRLPEERPGDFAARDGKADVIAFSLWGKNPQYLRGVVQNLLMARKYFPEWQLWFYLDDSVPPEFPALINELSGQVVMKPGGQSLRQRLCWRFDVANDTSVGHFLVRDVDSVIGLREAAAVKVWLDSDLWFHVIRDWWTHSDLMLAGLWGGVAGVLPSIKTMLANYSPEFVETPNIDQWFLRDKLWAYVRQSCLVHDRCFRMAGSVRLPGPEPVGNHHIGQNEFVARKSEQEILLRPWIEQYPCLVAK